MNGVGGLFSGECHGRSVVKLPGFRVTEEGSLMARRVRGASALAGVTRCHNSVRCLGSLFTRVVNPLCKQFTVTDTCSDTSKRKEILNFGLVTENNDTVETLKIK